MLEYKSVLSESIPLPSCKSWYRSISLYGSVQPALSLTEKALMAASAQFSLSLHHLDAKSWPGQTSSFLTPQEPWAGVLGLGLSGHM